MTDKTKPISASNPPESKGVKAQTGFQPTQPGTPSSPPSGGSNVQKPTKTAKKSK